MSRHRGSEVRCRERRESPFEGASPAECLAWTLLAARADDSDAWAPYLAALPSAIDAPTSGSWERKEVAELQIGEGIFQTAVCLAKDAKAARAIAGGAGLPGDAVPGEDDAARDARIAREWSWALSCVRSRAVELTPEGGGSPQSLLVPFVDMLNHVHEDPLVSWTSVPGDGDGDAGAAVALVAEQHISAGDELTISYATGASSDAFALYMGFLGGHNRWDSVELFKISARRRLGTPTRSNRSRARRWWTWPRRRRWRTRSSAERVPGSNFDWDGADASATRW